MRALPVALVVAGLALVGCAPDDAATSEARAAVVSVVPEGSVEVTVHRDPGCGCCSAWEDYMSQSGFTIVEEHRADMVPLKDSLGIPPDTRSCHTSVVEGYVVEGHVPADAVADLLAERPDIDGIAVAGMPPGSPGMPGVRTEPLMVTAFADGTTIGEFGRY